MSVKKICVLDHIRSLDDVYDVLVRELDLPEYFGRNFDALYDCLSGDVVGPVEIKWLNHEQAACHLGEEVFETLLNIFDDVQFEREDFTFVLA